MLKRKIISILNRLPYVNRLHFENQLYRENSCFPPGHFFSPIVDVKELRVRQDKIWPALVPDSLLGINLNTEAQKKLVKAFETYYKELSFTEIKTFSHRFYYENALYSYTDAICLYAMMRHFQPKQIIEIGSGFSSAVMLDTNSMFLNYSVDFTFIEPFPERLNNLITEQDKQDITLLEKNIQDVPLEVFEKLNSGDILFVDSTHVVKTGSDVNYILFEILPRLKKGVLIHFHDVFFPFEYPKEWVFKGRNWNEDYFLKAFLMYNNEFEIQLFAHYLHVYHQEVFAEMPLCYKNFGGNLWLRKKN